ncbi:MAG: hypothetical protein ACOYIS_03940 [Candidatus Cloacimonadaceae bacterium]
MPYRRNQEQLDAHTIPKSYVYLHQKHAYPRNRRSGHWAASGGLEKKLAKVPYVFSDPRKIDKKIDVKKLQFGSRLDDSEVKARGSARVSRKLSMG